MTTNFIGWGIPLTNLSLPDVAVSVQAGDGTATINWTVTPNGQSVDGVYVGRDGTDTGGTGAYESALKPGLSGSLTFNFLLNGTAYNVYVQAVVGGVRSTIATAMVTPAAVVTGDLAGWTLVKDFDMTANTGNLWVANSGIASRDASYSRQANMLFGTDANGQPTSGGKYLTILAQRADSTAQIYSVDAKTDGRFSVGNYFRAEVVVQGISNITSGMWPAPLWFRPDGAGEGEIDIDEQYGKESPNTSRLAHFTIHKTPYGAQHAQVSKTISYASIGDNTGGEAMHTYVVEKTQNKMEWFIDGRSIVSVGPADASWYGSMYEVGTRWYPRITYQVGIGTGSSTAGAVPDSWLESRMVIASIKLWEPSP